MSTNPKFSREDDQLLALNYENLCDGDYVTRLFNSEAGGEGRQGPRQVVHNDWTLTPDIAEDVLLFSESASIGLSFLAQRVLSEGDGPRVFEPGTAMLLKQVKIFSHIGQLVRERCQRGEVTAPGDCGPQLQSLTRALLGCPVAAALVPNALTCALSVLERRSSSHGALPLKAINFMLASVVESLRQAQMAPGGVARHALTGPQTQSLRAVLCGGVRKGLEEARRAAHAGTDVQSALRLTMYCVYGLFSVGVLTRSPGDVLLAMLHLMAIHSSVEDLRPHLKGGAGGRPGDCGPIPVIECQEKLRMRNKLKESGKAGLKQPPIIVGAEAREEGLATITADGRVAHSLIPLKIRDATGKKDAAQKGKLNLHLKSAVPGAEHREMEEGLVSKQRVGAAGTSSSTVAMSMSMDGAGLLQHSKSGPLRAKKSMHQTLPAGLQGANNNESDEFFQAGAMPLSPSANQVPYEESWNQQSGDVLGDTLNVPSGLLSALTDGVASQAALRNQTGRSESTAQADCPTQIWTCGQNSYGELGHGDVSIRTSFAKIAFFESKSIIGAGAGNEHSVFLSSQGKVFVTGYNDNGQCGLGTTQQVRQPTQVANLDGEDISKVQVFNGSEHTLLITRDGRLYAFGYNYRGQLGLGTTSSEMIPRLVKGLLSKKVRLAACSYHHSAAVCTDGSMYTFGRNDFGQLGHGDCIDRKTPQLVPGVNKPAVAVSCGQFHTTFVNSASQAFACGKNDFGQLGLENVENVKIFTKIDISFSQSATASSPVAQVCCGYYHTLVLLQSGLVLGCGRNDYGQLGLGHTQPRVHGLQPVSGLREKLVNVLSCGCYHSAAITSNGMMYVFGRNNHGQLGTGDNEERHVPHPVDNFVGRKILSVAAGFYHTIVLVGEHGPSSRHADDEHADPEACLNDDGYSIPRSEEALKPTADIVSSPSLSFYSNTDYPSSTSVAEVLKLLVSYIKNIPDQDQLYTVPSEINDSMTADEKLSILSPRMLDSLLWVSQQCRCLAALLQVTRRFVSPADSAALELPYSEDEAIALIGNVLRVTERFMDKARPMLSLLYELCRVSEVKDGERFAESLFAQDASSAANPLLILSEILVNQSAPPAAQSAGAWARDRLVDDITRLRRELLMTYFLLPPRIELTAAITDKCFSCLSKNSKLFFWSTGSYASVLSFLAAQLQEADASVEVERERSDSMSSAGAAAFCGRELDSALCFRLFTRLCSGFRDIRDVLRLFQSSASDALMICLQISSMYCFVSLGCLDGRVGADSGTVLCSPDLVVHVGMLEYCCANFVKCALPLILCPTSSATLNTGAFAVGGVIVKKLLLTAVQVVDVISERQLGDDELNSLRCGTVLLNVVPTVLLFGIANATSSVAAEFILPCVLSLKHALKQLSESDYHISRSFSLSQKSLGATSGTTSPPPIVTKPSAGGNDDSVLGRSDGGGTPSLGGTKKDPQFMWWSRLLRLCAIITTKLATILSRESSCSLMVKYAPSPVSSARELSVTRSSAQCFQCSKLSVASVWHFLEGVSDRELTYVLSLGTDGWAAIGPDVKKLSDELRAVEFKNNTNYRFTTSRKTPANAALGSIENAFFRVAYFLQEPMLRLLSVAGCAQSTSLLFGDFWHGIAVLVGSLHTRRSALLSHAELTWEELLAHLSEFVHQFCRFLTSCPRRCVLSPLLPGNGSRRVHPALRRALLVVMTSVRWRLAVRNKFSTSNMSVVGVAHELVEVLIGGVVDEAPVKVSKLTLDQRWKNVVEALLASRNLSNNKVTGLSLLCDTLDEPLYSGMRGDMLMMLTAAWRAETLNSGGLGESTNSSGAGSAELQEMYRGEGDLLLVHIKASRRLLCILRDMLLEFSCSAVAPEEIMILPSTDISALLLTDPPAPGAPPSVADMTMLSLISKGLEYLCAVNDETFVNMDSSLNPFICQVFTCTSSSVSRLREVSLVDDKAATQIKRSVVKERLSILRRSICSCIGLLQQLCIKAVKLGVNCPPATVLLLVSVTARLISQLQRAVLLVPSSPVDVTAAGDKDSKQGGGTLSSTSTGSSAASAAQKKRCQELISQPMSFCKGQEGFVVQGDKLLSNFKGVDFTISTWIYVTKKESGKHYFITGKVSHNDAWPILVLRGIDGKIDLAYGRANEFDRLTTVASVPLNCWTHIAVVCDPRKFKIFINGQLDSQTTTVGNARAILYPLIIGSCPVGVRTRVEHVRDGFDGYLSCYKYHTRAMSPIHARVVYDQGPPELFDSKERWIYQLTAVTSVLLTAFHSRDEEEIMKTAPMVFLANVMQSLFVSESGRVREASIRVLGTILSMGCCQDIFLSPHSLKDGGAAVPHSGPPSAHPSEQKNDDPMSSHGAAAGPPLTGESISLKPITSSAVVSVNSALFLSEGSNFYEKMVLYYLRIMGLCWISVPGAAGTAADSGNIGINDGFSVVGFGGCSSSTAMKSANGAASKHHGTCTDGRLLELTKYAAKFVGIDIFSGGGGGNATGGQNLFCLDKVISRDKLVGTLCHSLACSLRNLLSGGNDGEHASSRQWVEALNAVVYRILCKSRLAVSVREEWTTSVVVDIMGCTALLGVIPPGLPYPGCDVDSFYGASRGRVLSFDLSSQLVTLLLATKKQLLTVRVADVAVCQAPCASKKPMILQDHVNQAVLDLMDSLKPFLWPLVSDMLCTFHPEHPFIRQVLLKSVRPVETALFYQLLRYVVTSFDSFRCGDILSRDELFMTLVQMCARNEQVSLDSIQLRLSSSRCFVSDSWSKAGTFVSAVPEKVTHMEFPPSSDGDKCFADYSNKNLGIVVDTLPNPTSSRLLKNGMLCELIYSLSGNSESGFHFGRDQEDFSICPDSFPMSEYSLAPSRGAGAHTTSPYTSNNKSTNNTSELSDSDTLAALRLFYNLRSGILRHSQRLITSVLSASRQSFDSMTLYWKTVLWHSFSSKRVLNTHPDVSSLVDHMCRALSQDHQSESINFLTNCLRYASVSLFHMNFGRASHGRNILEHTDVYERLLKAAQSWIAVHGASSTSGIDMCLQLLKVLLPALAFIECSSVELRVILLCHLAVHNLLTTVMNFRTGTGRISYDVYASKGSEIYDMCRGNSFALLWSSAHEQLMKERGHALSQLSLKTTHLVHMAASMQAIQRLFRPTAVSTSDTSTPPPVKRSASRVGSSVKQQLTAEPDFVPRAPKGLEVYSTLAEIDVREVVSGAESWYMRVASGGDHSGECCNVDPASLAVEVQLRLHGDGEETEYETIFYGTARRFVHGGLAAGCKYDLRCRCICSVNLAGNNTGGSGVKSSWSEASELVTLPSGIPFTFDQCSCGPDIMLSDNGLVASYTGDDSWSTVLGTQGFVHGINSWEVRVTSSSTAYLFIGIATSQADLSTFLGGCKNGWGFIGEQALYHNREKVKIYGEPFMSGDVVGVTVNLISGTLSFTRNGKSLGVAFDKLYGEFYPAVAFYNVGQEVEIVSDAALATSCCPHEPIPCSPSRIHLDEVSLLLEAVYCLSAAAPLSSRLLDAVALDSSAWCADDTKRYKARSGRNVVLRQRSQLLLQQNFKVGEKVRTPYGVALVAGSAHNRVWFKHIESGEVWFFSEAQIVSGRDSGMFQRCTYYPSSLVEGGSTLHESVDEIPAAAAAMSFDATSISELLDPGKWSLDLDNVLVTHLLTSSSKASVSPWDVSTRDIFERYREIQVSLSKHVMRSVGLSHRWGITGPKRRAVVARVGLIRYVNHLAEHNMSALLQLGNGVDSFSCDKVSTGDDLYPLFTTIKRQVGSSDGEQCSETLELFRPSVAMSYAAKSNWPIISVFWGHDDAVVAGSADQGHIPDKQLSGENGNIVLGHEQSPFASIRFYLFSNIKHTHFFDVITRSSFRSAKTDDEYDYPDDLPQVKLNRFRSFRAMEASAALGVPGEDLYMSTMFCQLWKELRAHSVEKLRMSYTHPMDDGQSRAFKVKFEGEGVDDYGGPYREVFQKICEELQAPDHSSPTPITATEKSDSPATFKCFIPLLLQTPNWASSSDDCEERYKYIFNPSSSSPLHMDLYTFLGQFVGLAVRSKITIDLPLPSVIWKMVLREPLNVDDIASFDVSAASFVTHLGGLYQRYMDSAQKPAANTGGPSITSRAVCDAAVTTPRRSASTDTPDLMQAVLPSGSDDSSSPLLEELESLIQDLSWTVVRSDGRTVELVEGGSTKSVTIDNLGYYLSLCVQARLLECAPAVESFRNGFLSVIPESALTLLCWYDLKQIVCGADSIDVSRLQENTEYDDDVTPDDAHIVAFWDVLINNFTEEEKVMFLRFVWARPSLPPRGAEFSQKLKIQSAVGEDSDLKPDQYLPKAHTCFFSINLPRYSTKEVLADRLRYAIRNCTEMDADFRLTDADVAGWTSYASEGFASADFATTLE